MAAPPLKLDLWTLVLLVAQWALFIGNIGVAILQPGELWMHVLVGIVPIHFAFTIWHEAAHGTVSNRRWVNHVVGVLGMLPYMTPYFIQRHVHLDHHRHLNEPGQDPNEVYAGGPLWELPLRYWRLVSAARKAVADDPRTSAMKRSDIFFLLLVLGIWGAAIITGTFTALFFAWLLPFVIAKAVMDVYINYLPHVGLPPDRYRGTRVIDVSWLTPLVLAHNYHAIHHLWPAIPWHGYKARFKKKQAELREKGVPIEKRVFAVRAGRARD